MKLKKEKQFWLLKKAIDLAGSQRELSKKIGISNQNISKYASKTRAISEENFNKLVDFAGITKKDDLIEERLPDNWKQIIGGKECVISKKKKGTFDRDMKRLQKIQSVRLKKWHKSMKDHHPEAYYGLQYSRFKKVGNYKKKTLRGEMVRNDLEKDVADFLFKKGINYKYEPLVRIGDRAFFPDFLIDDKIIIECTAWKGFDKAIKLRDKIDILKKGYKVFVVIPKALNNYYKILNNHLILGLDDMPL